MIVGVGTDLIEVERIEGAAARHGDRFLRKLFTRDELRYCLSRGRSAEHLAGRFAAKEAVLKALGIGIRWGAALREIEVVRAPEGNTSVALSGRVAERARAVGVDRIHISLSHTHEHATAQAVAERLTTASPARPSGRPTRPGATPPEKRKPRRRQAP